MMNKRHSWLAVLEAVFFVSSSDVMTREITTSLLNLSHSRMQASPPWLGRSLPDPHPQLPSSTTPRSRSRSSAYLGSGFSMQQHRGLPSSDHRGPRTFASAD
ncbi:hypothetical protein B0T16DRAFT_401799 [Cercophora newfieldiana]|uniref:Secreted protein n=1 Tax=Cercophora newfieldiana TaxID=92897 RepID=A0AA39YRW7_9PEZI|nr:hypothetical protein B0T16DRAFT_401799 [Cercophora newfieldiana]